MLISESIITQDVITQLTELKNKCNDTRDIPDNVFERNDMMCSKIGGFGERFSEVEKKVR